MKTAVIYARYSSDSQTEQSIEGQLRVCGEYAQRNNIVVVGTYIDRAMTGTNDHRPDFQRMIKDSYKKEWDYVIVYKLDRFSRNKYETTIHKHTLSQNGVKLLSAMENIPDTPEGIILESLLEGMNQYYSAELSQKVKRGLKESRIKGNFTGGCILYGYYVENHKIKIKEKEAEVIRYIYKQYSLGIYVNEIIESLNKRRILNRGKPFTPSAIYKMLHNEKYSGIYRFDDEIYENMYPRIVPLDVFDKVRNISSENKYGRRSVATVYLLRNKMICGYCGMSICAESGTGGRGATFRYYKCLGRKRKNGCTQPLFKKEIFEDFVINTILEILNSPQYREKMIKNILKTQQLLFKENSFLTALIKEKKQAETRLNNIMQAVEQGLMNSTTNKRMKDLEKQIEELDRRILIEKSKIEAPLTIKDIQNFYLQALKMQPYMLINHLIKNIKVYKDKLEIILNNPLAISPNDSQKFLLYSKIKKYPKPVQNKNIPNHIDILVNIYV